MLADIAALAIFLLVCLVFFSVVLFVVLLVSACIFRVIFRDRSKLFVCIVEQTEHLECQVVLVPLLSHLLQVNATNQVDSPAHDVEHVEENFLQHLVLSISIIFLILVLDDALVDLLEFVNQAGDDLFVKSEVT